MISHDRWAETWIDCWNRRDLDGLISLYSPKIHLKSPFARVYAEGNGDIVGVTALRRYWGEVMRRAPNLTLEKVALYRGHEALALHYRDNVGRNVIECVIFDEQGLALTETVCLDKVR